MGRDEEPRRSCFQLVIEPGLAYPSVELIRWQETHPMQVQPIQCEEIPALLRVNATALREEFGFVRLAVFGSVARGEAAETSDVDIVVEFSGSATFLQFMALRERLQGLLGRPVDLVTTKALRPELRERIEGESLRVA